MQKGFDILWALVFLFIILDALFHQVAHTRNGIMVFRQISITIIIMWVVIMQIAKTYFEAQRHSQEEQEEKTSKRGTL